MRTDKDGTIWLDQSDDSFGREMPMELSLEEKLKRLVINRKTGEIYVS